MKRVILETLKELGFELTKQAKNAYMFDYEQLKFLCTTERNDDEYLSISLPGIVKMDGESNGIAQELMDHINLNMRYVKAFPVDGVVWISYEICLQDGMDMRECIKHMIGTLEDAAMRAYLLLSEMYIDDEVAGYDPAEVLNDDMEDE